jgi:tetratricopeptide (TPR) repeat protein
VGPDVGHPDTNIDTLEAKGLVAVAAYRPELEYLFRHWLVQDAAYGSLLKQERRQLHRLVGEALENLYPDRRNELAGILAMHFEQAGDAQKAIEYLVMDGRYALERAAVREAFAAFDRAEKLRVGIADRASDPSAERAGIELAILRARAGLTFRDPEEVATDLMAFAEAAEELGDLELVAQVHLYMALSRVESGVSADHPEVARSLDRLARISEELDDPSLAALPLAMIGADKVFTGPLREGVEALERAIPLMEKRRDFIGAAFARGWLAIGYATLGDFDQAERAAEQAMAEAADGDLIAQLDARIALAMVRSARGELEEAAPLALDCVERSEASGATACAVVSSWILGDVYQRQHRFAEAHDALRLGLALAPGSGSMGPWGMTLRLWMRASEEHLGQPPEGPDWDEALAGARARHDRLGEAAVLWKRAEVEAERGEPASFADFEAAAAIYEAEYARPNLARVLRGWGDALRQAGGLAEAREPLQRSLGLMESLGLLREAEEVRLALAA